MVNHREKSGWTQGGIARRMSGWALTPGGIVRWATCPRCSGAVALGEDTWGRYMSCISCGWVEEAGGVRKALMVSQTSSETGYQFLEVK